jgi:predicted methyltransferase
VDEQSDKGIKKPTSTLLEKCEMKKIMTSSILTALLVTGFSVLSLNANADGHAIGALLDQAVQGEHRTVKNKARDAYRHPKETLMFFGLKADMKVLEILPGGGWYTEILAPTLKHHGLLTVASFGENNPSEYMRNVHIRYAKFLDDKPEVYGKIKRDVFEDNGYLGNIAAESQDMVVTFRNSHNWIRFGGIEQAYGAFSRVLKKGGVLGVVQHRAEKGTDAEQTAEKGYVPEAYLIKLVESLGFKLVAKSEINANAKDTKDYPNGVWSLPPSYREKDTNRENYRAIGETDRMTLRFVKL